MAASRYMSRFKRKAAGRWGVSYLLMALLVGGFTLNTASAGARVYDMSRLLSEPHPFAATATAAPQAAPPTYTLPTAPNHNLLATSVYPIVAAPYQQAAQSRVRTRLKASPVTADGKTAKFNFADLKKDGVIYVIDIYDPIEGFNRGVYWFNAKFDQYVFLPIVNGYRFVTPEFAQDMITGFFDNIGEITTFANQIAQAKITEAGKTIVRFVVNSTMGLAGFFNTAAEMGLPRIKEDFGQTLGLWGVGNGPYLVLPLLGPSNLRDGIGQLTDTVALAILNPYSISSFQTDYPYVMAVKVIDGRHDVGFRYYDSGSPFEYEKVRLLYTTKRRLDIQK